MAGGRRSALLLPIDSTSTSEFQAFRSRTPLFTVSAGRVLVTLALPERLGASDVEFARGLGRAGDGLRGGGGAAVPLGPPLLGSVAA